MDEAADSHDRALCPICGKPAEVGCIYGPDGQWFAELKWRAGDPSVASNFITSLGGGTSVGEYSLFRGPYARGIRCSRCRRIVLEI